MITILKDRLKKLRKMVLLFGSHEPDGQMCAMEAAAWIAGEPWTDHPACVCPVIGAFMRSWNDGITDDAERTAILVPLVPLTIGTKATKEVEYRRAFMCIDWSLREFTPSWLECCDPKRYAVHVAALRAVPEITDWQRLIDATPILVNAQKEAAAARDAAWDAARAAAWDAAWDAARDAARDAAWDAARAAAWDAARAAARAAAWDAARAAAWDAARAAARDAVKPTKKRLQASASALVKRMCALTEEPREPRPRGR